MKQDVIAAIVKISEEDFLKATERWIGGGMNPESMLRNFISILEEY